MPPPTDLDTALSLLTSWIEATIAAEQIPGLSIGIVHRDHPLWTQGFGHADIQTQTPVTPQTLFRIASISKTFTATALMQLRDAGNLGLDDAVEDHLSWFRLESPFPDAPSPTIRHLLTHTAGLPREAAFPYWDDFDFPDLPRLKEGLARQAFAFAPGQRFKYSNLGYALAGQIVAAAAGQPYAEYVQQHILDPLGMGRTSVFPSPAHKAALATGYSRLLPGQTRHPADFTDARAIAPAANFTTCIDDLMPYLAFQLGYGPDNLISPHTLRQMHALAHIDPDWSGGRSLGFVVYRRLGRTLVGHGGHVYGYRSQILFCPEEGIGVAVQANATGFDPLECALQAMRLVAPALAAAATPEATEQRFDPAWDKYLGRYRNAWGDEEVKRLGEKLVLLYPEAADIDTSQYEMVPLADGSFRLEGSDGGGPVGERAVFETDPDGKVTRLKLGQSYTYPHEGRW